ncbi:MAG: NIPSNAP family containing protein [Eudoraea sp.]|nr:NIPSNAP family containing protein [Eudoraea sp.]
MKNLNIGLLVLGTLSLLLISQCTVKRESKTLKDYYELRIYTLADDIQEERTDAYLENAFLPALKRNNVENIGVFKFKPEIQDSIQQIFVLYPIMSPNQLTQLTEILERDSILLKDGRQFLKAAHDTPPYERLEIVQLKAFKDMPFMRPSSLKGPREKRVYELRSYESPTEELYRNKVEMFNEGGEITLFEDLGFNAVFYAEVIAGSRMPNLMYMTTFKDMETRDTLWKDFVDSDTWKELSGDPKYQNNVSRADIHLLYPTTYSDY